MNHALAARDAQRPTPGREAAYAAPGSTMNATTA
jgi:hypothetical protein